VQVRRASGHCLTKPRARRHRGPRGQQRGDAVEDPGRGAYLLATLARWCSRGSNEAATHTASFYLVWHYQERELATKQDRVVHDEVNLSAAEAALKERQHKQAKLEEEPPMRMIGILAGTPLVSSNSVQRFASLMGPTLKPILYPRSDNMVLKP